MRLPRMNVNALRGGRATVWFLLASLALVTTLHRAQAADHFAAASPPVGPSSPDGQFPPTLDVTGTGPGFGVPDYASGDPLFNDDVSVGGFGAMGRIGHIAPQTVGREESITHIELMPYLFVEDLMFFGDWRLFRTNSGDLGGSVGLGLRHYLSDYDIVFGGSAWYDIDDTRESQFQQVGLSLELFSRHLDVRANWYVPVGNQERELGTTFVAGSQRFEGYNLLFDTRTEFGSAADGVDMLFSVPVAGEIPQHFNLEASAGWYHFQVPNTDLTRIWGWKLRADADFFENWVHGFVEFTSDRVFDNNVIAGASVNYYHNLERRPRLSSSQYYRMSEWVRRNYNVVTIDDAVVNAGQPVINPATGQPYTFAHVRNITDPVLEAQFPTFPAPTGMGTVEMPYQYIREAQQGIDPEKDGMFVPADVIYVQANSVFDETVDGQLNTVVRLNDNEILLGEGVPQSLPVPGFGAIPLPVVVGGSKPLITNTTVDAIVVANDNLMGGFDVSNVGGNGLVGNGIVNGTFRDLRLLNGTGDGILLTNPSGRIQFLRDSIGAISVAGQDSFLGNGFHVNGGAANITYNDTIVNTNNYAVLVENTFGGLVDFQGTTVTDTSGSGILLQNNIGGVTLDTGTITNSDGTGIQILDAEGTVTILNDWVIENPAGVGLDVDNLQSSLISPGSITVNNRNAIGADFTNISGLVEMFGDLTINALNPTGTAGVNDPGINFQTSSGSVRFTNLLVADSNGVGINIGDPTGTNINQAGATFTAIGNTTVTNTALPAIQISGGPGAFDPTDVNFNIVTISGHQNRGIQIERTSGPINFLGTTSVTDNVAAPNGFAALFIEDISGSVGFNTFTANNNGPPEPAVLIQNIPDPGSVSFNRLNVLNAVNTEGVNVFNVNSFSSQGGDINVTGATAVDIQDTNYNAIFTSITSSLPPDFGVYLEDNVGRFSVTGDGLNLGSGGTITGAPIAAVRALRADELSLNYMTLNTNGIGVFAEDMTSVALDSMQIMGSVEEGVRLIDTQFFLAEDSFFTDNGVGGGGILVPNQQHIRALMTQLHPDPDIDDDVPYSYLIQRNTFQDGVGTIFNDDAIFISSVASASGSQLDLIVQDNLAIMNRSAGAFLAGAAFLNVAWQGPLNSTVQRNDITTIGNPGERAFIFSQTGLGNISNIVIDSNIATFAGGAQDIGTLLNFTGPANVSFTNNQFGFGGLFATGLQMSTFAGGNSIVITGNLLDFNADGGTGMLFPVTTAPAFFRIADNTINLTNTVLQFPGERGIIFNAINGVINLAGNLDNFVNVFADNATIIFQIPPGSSTGQIPINGVFVP